MAFKAIKERWEKGYGRLVVMVYFNLK